MLFLEKLEQKRFYLIAVIILCMLIGGIYGLKFADKESLSSTSVMLVKKANSQDSSLLNDGTLELSKNLVSTYEELIKSDSNLDNIKNKKYYLKNLILNHIYQTHQNKLLGLHYLLCHLPHNILTHHRYDVNQFHIPYRNQQILEVTL